MPADDEIIASIEQLEAQAEALVTGLRELKAQVTPARPGLPAAERRAVLPEVEAERAELPRPPRPHVEGELADEEASPPREPIIAPAAPVVPEIEARTAASPTRRSEPSRRKRHLGLLLLGLLFLLISFALSSTASFVFAALAATIALLALVQIVAGWVRSARRSIPTRQP